MPYSPWRFCIAPMMEYSDRHYRYLWRLMSQNARVYTEMVVTGAILHGDRERFLGFSQEEAQIALQLGGSDPEELGQCSRIAEQWGYNEVNLNCGCPSDRVQKGKIGAVLMREPELVAECVAAMKQHCSIPVTVKHRIGIDDREDYDALAKFVELSADAGSEVFIVHARNAWLKGLSPKQNREVPPLRYEWAARLKRDFPKLCIVVNGGIRDLQAASSFLAQLDGVMLGRAACDNPWLISQVDQQLFGDSAPQQSRAEVIKAYAHYASKRIKAGDRPQHIFRHILNLYTGQPGGKIFRRRITEQLTARTLNPESLITLVEEHEQEFSETPMARP
jgi:tRNA-dihydrouridine synthase A